MLIDWFTVAAQVINFLVLAWLLKRFLYRPVLNAIDAREQRIAAELADADATRAEAEQQRDQFKQKNAEFDQQRVTRMNQLTEAAKAERTRLMDAVRQESDVLRSKLQLALKNEQHSLQDTLSKRTKEEVFAIVRKALSDLAETTLEVRMAEIFIERLDKLNEKDKAGLLATFQVTDQPMVVRTAFALPEQQYLLIETALRKIIGSRVQIEFAVAPDLVCGIEINADSQKIAWSIGDYLDSLLASVDQILQSQHKVMDNVEINKEAKTEQGSHEISS
jgi:F-type H+-transporting ATPase subunit b